jgi:hypothetical protein
MELHGKRALANTCLSNDEDGTTAFGNSTKSAAALDVPWVARARSKWLDSPWLDVSVTSAFHHGQWHIHARSLASAFPNVHCLL